MKLTLTAALAAALLGTLAIGSQAATTSTTSATAATQTAAAATAATAPTIINAELSGAKLPLVLKVDRLDAKPGRIVFKVANMSKATSQPIIVARLRKDDAQTMSELKDNKINITDFKRLAAISGIRPGDHLNFGVKLKTGNYVLLYKNKSGFETLMSAPLAINS